MMQPLCGSEYKCYRPGLIGPPDWGLIISAHGV